ncbi:TPA: hypothetical protein R8Q91_001800, partial [Campylobacter jejuni]|nr:hypothetical protein [Campylobacter jejuni]
MQPKSIILFFYGYILFFRRHLSFDSSKIETKAPKIELSLSSLYQNADEVVKGVIYILVLFSILAWAVFISKLMQFYFMK